MPPDVPAGARGRGRLGAVAPDIAASAPRGDMLARPARAARGRDWVQASSPAGVLPARAHRIWR
jgi:hypothetical protein